MTYGKTILLNDMFDFTFDPNRNTLTLVSGEDNVVQAIKLILKVMLGEIRTFPTFGIDIPQLLDKNISDDNIKHAISNAIIRDPRIKSIDQITLERINRTLNISMQVTSYSGAILDFRDSLSW